jgi:predicted transcriptional regulator
VGKHFFRGKYKMLATLSSPTKNYRNRIEIIYLMLGSIGITGAGFTRIMFSSFISYAQCKEYLKELQKLGLTSYHESTKKYKVTAKGEHFMSIYKDIKGELEGLGEQ